MARVRRGLSFMAVAAMVSALSVAAGAIVAVDKVGDGLAVGWLGSKAAGVEAGHCTGSIAECLGENDEVGLNRRILATSDYITYQSLEAGNRPCSNPGAPYYNCQINAQLNPYNRGCEAITRCKSM